MFGCMDVWMHGCMDVCMDEWMYGCMDVCIVMYTSVHTHVPQLCPSILIWLCGGGEMKKRKNSIEL